MDTLIGSFYKKLHHTTYNITPRSHSGRLASKLFLFTIEVPPGTPKVSKEGPTFTKQAIGGLAR